MNIRKLIREEYSKIMKEYHKENKQSSSILSVFSKLIKKPTVRRIYSDIENLRAELRDKDFNEDDIKALMNTFIDSLKKEMK